MGMALFIAMMVVPGGCISAAGPSPLVISADIAKLLRLRSKVASVRA
jgi:hypothetical protein